jgi:5-methylcytosine-specific restriction endonuclease McrBC regulatory subunit McrC
MAVDQTVHVRERSSAALAEAAYRRLEASPAALSLVDAGILSFIRSRSIPFGVRAGPFVGRANIDPELTISVDEKVDGTLRSLLAFALPADIRTAAAPSFVDADSPVLELFASRFLDELGRHLVRGRVKEYRQRAETSSVPRGRIDLRATLNRRAHGRFDRVAYHRPVLSANIPINRVFALALRAVDAYASVAPTSSAMRVRARRLSTLFDDVPVADLLRSTPSSLRRLTERALADVRSTDEIRRALEYGRALILYLGAWSDTRDAELPESYFANLEVLFEEAVRAVLGEVLGRAVTKGGALKQSLFVDVEDAYLVDPDLVALRDDGTPLLVGDVKYKDLVGTPDHADIYQLAAHAHALSATRAVLVYPGGTPHLERLGTTTAGVEIWWAVVRAVELPVDLEATVGQVVAL